MGQGRREGGGGWTGHVAGRRSLTHTRTHTRALDSGRTGVDHKVVGRVAVLGHAATQRSLKNGEAHRAPDVSRERTAPDGVQEVAVGLGEVIVLAMRQVDSERNDGVERAPDAVGVRKGEELIDEVTADEVGPERIIGVEDAPGAVSGGEGVNLVVLVEKAGGIAGLRRPEHHEERNKDRQLRHGAWVRWSALEVWSSVASGGRGEDTGLSSSRATALRRATTWGGGSPKAF